MGNRLEFWFEFGSTYSYPAAMRIEALAAAAGVTPVWRAFLLGPIFREQGLNDSPFNLFPAKGRYMWRDLERVCEKHGLPFRRPSAFPRNGLLAARVACAFADAAWLPAFVRAVYLANFAQDRDIADPELIRDILHGAGLPAGEILDCAQSAENKEHLRTRTAEAAARGVFGAPTFFAGGEMFWGHDRLYDAIAQAART